MIEPYPFILDYGITPDTPAHALGMTARQPGLGVEGTIIQPGSLSHEMQTEAKQVALFLEGTRKWLRSKSRRHHNNKGYRRIKNDQCHKEVKAIGERFFSG